MTNEEAIQAIREIDENETDVFGAYSKNLATIVMKKSGNRAIIQMWIYAVVGFIVKLITLKMKKSMSKAWKTLYVVDLVMTFPITFLLTIFFEKIASFQMYLILSMNKKEVIDEIGNVRTYLKIQTENLHRNTINEQERVASLGQ